jgi:sodium/proline symporter
MLTGFFGITYFAGEGTKLEDPETVFIVLGEVLFHPFITGFLISAILAAIMSTISSQLLVTASSLTEDMYKTFFRRSASDKELVFLGRMSVLLISVIALILSWEQNDTILGLVGYAWAGFGSSFGPLILLSLFWKRMTKWGALAGMVVGAATVIIWSMSGLSDMLYEMIPGFAASLIAIVAVSLITPQPPKEAGEQFDEFERVLKQ